MPAIKYELTRGRTVFLDPEWTEPEVGEAIDETYQGRAAWVGRGPEADTALVANVPTYLTGLNITDEFETGVLSVRFLWGFPITPPLPPTQIGITLDYSRWLGDHDGQLVIFGQTGPWPPSYATPVVWEELIPVVEGYHQIDALVTAGTAWTVIQGQVQLIVTQL